MAKTQFISSVLEEHKYKIELHTHTSNVSACSDISAQELVVTYYSEKYSGIVLTNHFFPWQPQTKIGYNKYVDNYISEYYEVMERGAKLGIKIYLGMEIRLAGSKNDYLLYGIDERFIREALSPKIKTLTELSKVSRSKDTLLIQAHPFRNDMSLMPSELLDGIEVYNLQPNANSRVGIAAKYAESLKNGVFICGTDFHHAGEDSLTALLTNKVPEDEKELVRCMKDSPIYKVGKSTIIF